MLYKPESLSEDQLGTSDVVELDHDTESGGYSEVQLATALQWDKNQRKLILLEQFLAKHDAGKYSAFDMQLFSNSLCLYFLEIL